MTALAVLLAACAGWLALPGLPQARRSAGSGRRPPVAADRLSDPRVRRIVCVGGAALGLWALAGVVGAAVGAGAGLALAEWLGRQETPAAARSRAEVERDLPLAAELLAACAAAGRAPQTVLPLVGTAIGGALGARLAEISAELALGADPVTAWTRCTSDPQLTDLARAMVRAFETGAPLASSLRRFAEDSRRSRRTLLLARARAVGVRAAAPLALCFLPAFLLVGVVPTVAGSVNRLFG